ncbi:amidohydrolase [Acinetobacter sp. PFS20]|uniref:amidohydrolase n=1 Tax=Acinetobacter sp. PFS20 TaxID=3458434 RepID=UPI003FD40315
MNKIIKNSLFLGLSTFIAGYGTLLHAEASPTTLPAVSQKALTIIDGQTEWLSKVYKDIHEHPELGFMETRTSAIVAKELKSLGFDVKTGIAKTGVVSILKNGDGPTVMYRADMDANTVQEATGLPYASKVRVKLDDGTETPVAHMCGHDAHVTWMLSMAKTLVALKKEWSGTIILVAQPAEEPVTGAKAMVSDGLWTKYNLPKPDYFFAVHTTPAPVGTIINAPGPRMAGTDQLDILFKGVGGHGSLPYLTKNPISMAANAITQYQTIMGSAVNTQQPAALSIGSVQAGNSNNVIPSTALVKMNMRWFDPKVRETMLNNIKLMSEGAAEMQGMGKDQLPTLTLKGSTNPVINNKEFSARLNGPLKALLGDKQVLTDFPPFMGSEDVHHLLGDQKDIPFNFMFIGVADPVVFANAVKQGKPVPYIPHSPNYIVDLKALPVGAKVTTVSMLELLTRK